MRSDLICGSPAGLRFEQFCYFPSSFLSCRLSDLSSHFQNAHQANPIEPNAKTVRWPEVSPSPNSETVTYRTPRKSAIATTGTASIPSTTKRVVRPQNTSKYSKIAIPIHALGLRKTDEVAVEPRYQS